MIFLLSLHIDVLTSVARQLNILSPQRVGFFQLCGTRPRCPNDVEVNSGTWASWDISVEKSPGSKRVLNLSLTLPWHVWQLLANVPNILHGLFRHSCRILKRIARLDHTIGFLLLRAQTPALSGFSVN